MEICIDKRQAVLQIKLGHRKAVDFMGNKNLIITIEREYGSGGRIVGRKLAEDCLLYTSPSPRDRSVSRMPSSA